MRSLLASLFLLILTLAVCIWCAVFTENATSALANAAKLTPRDLERMWQERKFLLSMAVNRALIAECESALARMQACKEGDALFAQAQRDFLTTLSVIRESYGLHLGAMV